MYCLNICVYNLIYIILCIYEWKLIFLDLLSILYVYECDDKLFLNM